ncbi:MAG: sigma-70 family RNA polymerase sigma factor [Candidatus Cloacimonadaceae bacterium]|nr:sigma-70 family RNA polymerase sigma factor [Candidatus Cloacimonadaceae bacterium]
MKPTKSTVDKGFPADQDSLIGEYAPLAFSIALSYRRSSVPVEDLKQEALIGLLEAYKRFEQGYEAKFSTYAVYWIKKRVLEAIDRESGNLAQAGGNELPEQISAEPEPSADTDLGLPDDMPPLERQILILSYEKRLSIKEIACALSISNERVKLLRQKALRRLKSSSSGPKAI